MWVLCTYTRTCAILTSTFWTNVSLSICVKLPCEYHYRGGRMAYISRQQPLRWVAVRLDSFGQCLKLANRCVQLAQRPAPSPHDSFAAGRAKGSRTQALVQQREE